MNYFNKTLQYSSLVLLAFGGLVANHYFINPPIQAKLTAIDGNTIPKPLLSQHLPIKNILYSGKSLTFLPDEKGHYQHTDDILYHSWKDNANFAEIKKLANMAPQFVRQPFGLTSIKKAGNFYFWIEDEKFNEPADQSNKVTLHLFNDQTKQADEVVLPLTSTLSTNTSPQAYYSTLQSRVVDNKIYVFYLSSEGVSSPHSPYEETRQITEIFSLDLTDPQPKFKSIQNESYTYPSQASHKEESYSHDFWIENVSPSGSVTSLEAPFVQFTYRESDGSLGPSYYFDFTKEAWQAFDLPEGLEITPTIIAADAEKIYYLEYDKDQMYLSNYSIPEDRYQGRIPLEHFENLSTMSSLTILNIQDNHRAQVEIIDKGKKYIGTYDLTTGQTDSLYRFDLSKEYQDALDFTGPVYY